MTNPITAIRKFYFETVSEMKKCTWPGKSELLESAAVVISSLIILALFVFVADQVIGFCVRFITGMHA